MRGEESVEETQGIPINKGKFTKEIFLKEEREGSKIYLKLKYKNVIIKVKSTNR